MNPSLVQLLQINNNKQGIPLLTEDTMGNTTELLFFFLAQFKCFLLAGEQLTNNEKNKNNTNPERFFAVEIAQGYIIVNRE